MIGRRSFLAALFGAPLVRHIPAPQPTLYAQSFYSMRLNFDFDEMRMQPISDRDFRIPFNVACGGKFSEVPNVSA